MVISYVFRLEPGAAAFFVHNDQCMYIVYLNGCFASCCLNLVLLLLCFCFLSREYAYLCILLLSSFVLSIAVRLLLALLCDSFTGASRVRI